MAAVGVALHPDLADGGGHGAVAEQLLHVLVGAAAGQEAAEVAVGAVPTVLPVRAGAVVGVTVEDAPVRLRVVASTAAAAPLPDLQEWAKVQDAAQKGAPPGPVAVKDVPLTQ